MKSFLNIHDQAVFIDQPSEVRDILLKGKYTTLALSDGNDSYVLTLNYGLDKTEDILYFHCSSRGTKLDFFKSNPYVCGTVIQDYHRDGEAHGYPYESVVFYGLLEVIHKREEKIKALSAMRNQLKYKSDMPLEEFDIILETQGNELIMRLIIEEITGKRNPG